MSAKVHKPGGSGGRGSASSPSAVEYGILVAGLAVVIIALVFMLGPRVKKLLEGGGAARPAPATAPPGP